MSIDQGKPKATIEFYRLGGYADSLRSYELEVDGKQVGSIRRHTSVTVEVGAGSHRVQARIGGSYSDKIEVVLKPDSLTRIQVSPAPGPEIQKLFKDPYLLIAPDDPSSELPIPASLASRQQNAPRRISFVYPAIGVVAVGISAVERHWLAAALLLLLMILGSVVHMINFSGRTPK